MALTGGPRPGGEIACPSWLFPTLQLRTGQHWARMRTLDVASLGPSSTAPTQTMFGTPTVPRQPADACLSAARPGR